MLTDYNHTIYLSARAIDEVNVRLIMERLGGGGHLNIAGPNTNSTIPAAIELLKSTITQMKEEGSLMKVILLEDVKTLGKKEISSRFPTAMHGTFCFRKKAQAEATPKNLKDLEMKKKSERACCGGSSGGR